MAEMVELKNIHKSFGSNHILKGVNMSIGKGEVVVILGPSGSGKTTLLRTINFLDAADEGIISVSGFEVDAKKHSKSQVIELRRKTAMVFQNYNLFANKTILENVMEGLVTVKKFKKSDAKEMSLEILKKVGLEQRCDFYPAQLSGGQQQRAGIARALILDPDVILFKNLCVDECFGATRISSGFPSSTTTPPSINTTLDATSLANAISCVTTIIVIPVCATALMVFKTSPTSSGSSADVGSSK